MKYLFILALFLTSCYDTTLEVKESESIYNGKSVKEVKYEGCTYVVFNEGDMAWGGHKGNCSNPIHNQ